MALHICKGMSFFIELHFFGTGIYYFQKQLLFESGRYTYKPFSLRQFLTGVYSIFKQIADGYGKLHFIHSRVNWDMCLYRNFNAFSLFIK